MENKILYGSLSILLASIILIELKVNIWPYFLLVALVLFTLGTVVYVIEILRGSRKAGKSVIVEISDVVFAIIMWFMNVFLQFKASYIINPNKNKKRPKAISYNGSS